MLTFLADIRSCVWFVRLLWRVSSKKSLPREQWFAGALDSDVRWLAEQDMNASDAQHEAHYLILEAKREFARRGLA